MPLFHIRGGDDEVEHSCAADEVKVGVPYEKKGRMYQDYECDTCGAKRPTKLA